MDALQERIATAVLGAVGAYGFVLAGGQSLQAHGLVDRPSDDLDLFTDRADSASFRTAVHSAVDGLDRAGFSVVVIRQEPTFARLEVSEPSASRTGLIDMAVDARQYPPATLWVGPVLDERDAVGSKVATVFSRAYARDYIDLAGILRSGKYRREELMTMAADVDPGFRREVFRDALEGVDRLVDDEFARYGLDDDEIRDVREAMRMWASELRADSTR